MKIIFRISIALVFYTFFGYGIVLFSLVKLRTLIKGKRKPPIINPAELPTLSLIVAAYNEENFIEEKIRNTLNLTYPEDKIQYIFITDGSTDHTPEIILRYAQITLMHKPERTGKIPAVHRAMQEIKTDVVIFTDANTFLNKESLINICRHYNDEKVGCVSGEKRVHIEDVADATAGEGFYWKYESKLKQWDAELYSVVGAAGELFSVRTKLFEAVPADTILDDVMISQRIAEKGYRIVYEPEAYATETSSENVDEEMKRKVRIAAGGIQSIIRLSGLMNIFKHPVLSFQYISHRVLRWTITPFLMILAFILNAFIAINTKENFYEVLFALQVLLYLSALLGWLFERKQLHIKILFIPFYFGMMNYAVIEGIIRYFSGNQKVTWEKAKRK
jgi:biofilm PGA synthesis N-glycosyltransferase PgaC